MKLTIIIITFLCSVNGLFAQKGVPGVVYAADSGSPLPGATLRLLSSGLEIRSDEEGKFIFTNWEGPDSVRVSFIGYLTRTIYLGTGATDQGLIKVFLENSESGLQEVVIQTGYYQLSRERVTGSFEHVDHILLQRTAGPDLLTRLDGIAGGVQFVNPGGVAASDIRVRGLSTIASDETPLIVVDHFPYEGAISDIDPNIVESITILKDAAASSIWGARAGNGVIVITTKKGGYRQKSALAMSSSTLIGAKPDLFYSRDRLPTSVVMDIERRLYQQGSYTLADRTALPAYVELLLKRDQGLLSQEDFERQEHGMREVEIRQEVLDHLMQQRINQQHALSASGGGDHYGYQTSLGYNTSRSHVIGNGSKNLNLRFHNVFRPIPDLEIGAGIYYVEQRQQGNGLNPRDIYGSSDWVKNQYMRLEANGTALPVTKDYRQTYVEKAMENGLLDWQFRPLDELHLVDVSQKSNQLMVGSDIRYNILQGVNMAVHYQYHQGRTNGMAHYDEDSYFVRNTVNRFTQADGARVVPLGGIVQGMGNGESVSHSGRFQGNVDKAFDRHQVNGLAGAEIRQSVSDTYPGYVLYGFDQNLYTGQHMFDYATQYTTRPQGRSRIWQPNPTRRQFIDRYISYFANAGYQYDRKYTFSGSVRWDGSNLFGVKAHQKGKLLWSLGASWDLVQEAFFPIGLVTSLRLRSTYGSSGNVNKTVSHFPVISLSENTTINQLSATLRSVGNPSLRWERVNTLNMGLDYVLRGNRIAGSIEYYDKHGVDLIGEEYLPPSAGLNFSQAFQMNYANIRTHGVDIRLTSRNLRGALDWSSTVLFNYVVNKITNYNTRDVTELSYYFDGDPPPTIGRSRDAVFALRWHGLDGNTGYPIVYDREGQQTFDYPQYYADLVPDDLLLLGVSVPPFYGSLRNDFRWKGFSLSAMLSCKAGHVYRQSSMTSGLEYRGIYHMDYLDRWKAPGDEKYTHVPAAIAMSELSQLATPIYGYSEVLVKSGSNVRLQDLSIAYSIASTGKLRLPVESLKLYVQARNLGVVWKQTKGGIDPDYPNAEYVAPRTFSIGFNVRF